MSLIGRKVPEFKATAFKKGEKDFITVTDKDLLGKWSVFVFYPADFTFVCPTELEDLQDNYEAFKKEGAEVYSVSCDTAFVHKAWADHSERIKKVTYPMVADPTGFIGREAKELLRKLQGAKFVAEHGEVCPAKWQPGSETLKPSLDLIGEL